MISLLHYILFLFRDEDERSSVWMYQSLLLLALSLTTYTFHHTPFLLITLASATFLSSCDPAFHEKVRKYGRAACQVTVVVFECLTEVICSSFSFLCDTVYSKAAVEERIIDVNINKYSPRDEIDDEEVRAWVEQDSDSDVDFEEDVSLKKLIQPVYVEPKKNRVSHACNSLGLSTSITSSANAQQLGHFQRFQTTLNEPYISSSNKTQSGTAHVPKGKLNEKLQLRRPTLDEFRKAKLMGNAAVMCGHKGHTRAASDAYMTTWHHGATVSPVKVSGEQPMESLEAHLGGKISSAQTLKSKMFSFLGRNQRSARPPGMHNNGRNICFVNAVLQCLIHTPGLARAIDEAALQVKSLTNLQYQLVGSLLILIQESQKQEATVLDTFDFCQAGAAINPGLISSQSFEQVQQDAAEFMMWLFYVLHNALNSKVKPDSLPGSPNRSFQSLNTDQRSPLGLLKFIYGDLTPHAVEGLKHECQRQIELSGGLDPKSLAEPLQRLSDLEWMSYKEENSSPLDDLFTGQCVEAQHCLSCNRISVNTQTFSLLPVPILSSKLDGGLPVIHLEDCFEKFSKVEELQGGNGLMCSCVPGPVGQQNFVSPTYQLGSLRSLHRMQTPDIITHTRHFPSADSRLNSPRVATWSPIMATTRDGILSDPAIFRTSTPVELPNSPCRTAGQKFTLLRQLPECLVIQLLRFMYDPTVANSLKIHVPVEIPVTLNLAPVIFDHQFSSQDTNTGNKSEIYLYDLYAVCVHIGTGNTFTGHYIAYILSENTWYKTDDESSLSVNINEALQSKTVRENAYLLFYKKHALQDSHITSRQSV